MLNFFKYTTFALVIIGALNWGLVGFFQFDLVAFLFGDMSWLSRLIYDIIGISAIIFAILGFRCHREIVE